MKVKKETPVLIRKLSSGDIAVFCLQLSLILKAGIPLHEGLAILGDKENTLRGETDLADFANSTKQIRGILVKAVSKMAAYVEMGETLSSAMKKSGGFHGYVINMVEIGEETGKLDNILESLGDYYERDLYMKAKIRNSLMYPVFLFSIMSVVIVLLVSRIFPIFRNMLESMGGSLSAGAEAAAVFAGSLAAGEYTMYIILFLTLIIVIIALLSKTRTGKDIGAAVFALFPLTKNISGKIAASRFAGAMALTLSSGMDFSSAMRMAVNIIDAGSLKNNLEYCMSEIESGKSFTKSVAETNIFSSMYIKFMEIGQKTGNLDSVMKKISDICENEADSSLNNATSFIEPLLVGVLSVIIGVILISVMIPLVQVMSNIA